MRVWFVRRLWRERFLVTWLGVFVNPAYIVRKGLLRAIQQFANDVQGEVLDFGCGSKPYEELFSHASRYIGVDTYSSGHDHKHSRVDIFYEGSVLPFPAETFDTVVSFEVVEHLFNVEDNLAELFRVLRPGGKLLVSAPFSWEETEPPFDYARYTVYGLKSLVENAGFEILSQKRTTSAFLALRQMQISFLHNRIKGLPPLLRYVVQLLIIAPFTAISILGDKFWPDDETLYSNQVMLAIKIR